ncbi:metalloprotease TldD [Sulfuritalea hydrogenivorans]|jgi:TldD protein|uniref:Peptidase U62 modulator of DNA gyrase n=1 Tax=Sulfuritalea hydrogenivorans sk43H TaxID=1223802 RepID=W0SIR6_9PROT|nr:metalloprotease TldD [Sulfuritalea hydrogenivorans]MDK9714898.1 metalloprotease TldD [Sulfuritalea sp.]BAO30822.1 peptidase U62 modulator of DNA gyrase [Sulfuritalea hydrogenivorans sk43H]
MNAPASPIPHFDIAEQILLKPHGLAPHMLERVFGQLFGHRVDYADLYFQYARSEAWSLEEGIVKSGSFNIEQGVGVRAISGEKTAFAYSDDISLEALKSAANTTRAIAAAGAQRLAPLLRRGRQPATLYAGNDPIASLDDAAKVTLLERLEAMARAADPRVKEVMASIAGTWEVVLVARADGHMAADVRPLVRVSISVIMEEKGRREQGSSGGGGRFDYAYFTDTVLGDYARRAVHQASVNLAAKPAPAGEMTVVLGPGWPGILLHEAVGHGLEGDFNRKGSSTFAGRIGQRVAARGVTVVDDGTIADRRGSLTIDDEGNPTQRTVLIEDGILVGYLQDTLNARLMNVPITGNARRESFAHLPLPRMTNTTMLNGSHDPAEIIKSVKKGLYAANFGGGQVDITSGKFVFSTAEAYLIENGRITTPVKGATLIGNGPEAMNRVSMIGNDMALDSGVGTCGKEGQSVPVGVGQPTVRIDGLTVGGTG